MKIQWLCEYKAINYIISTTDGFSSNDCGRFMFLTSYKTTRTLIYIDKSIRPLYKCMCVYIHPGTFIF